MIIKRFIHAFLCREEGSNTSAKWSESPSKGSSLHIRRLRIVLNDAQLNVSNVKMIIEPMLPPDHQQESTPGLKAHVHNYQAVCNNFIIISGVLVVLRKRTQNTQIALSVVCLPVQGGLCPCKQIDKQRFSYLEQSL